jgi:probable F420-dependent oxidoreductase
LKIGFFLPQNATYNMHTDVVQAARAAEHLGYDSVWAFERLLVPEDQTGAHRSQSGDGAWPAVYRSVADPFITLATAAAVTSRVSLGTAAVLPPLHMPFRLAKSFASLDAASGGRALAGLGIGWSVDEHTATAPRPLRERGAAIEEFLDMAEAMWGENPVSFANERYTVVPSEVGPKPVGRLPVLLGGRSEKTLDRVARRADGWLPVNPAPADLEAPLSRIRAKMEEYGRDPASLSCIAVVAFSTLAELPAKDRPPYAGSIRQIVSDLADLAQAGADEAVFTISQASRNVTEVIDVAAEFQQEFRSTGL